MCFLGFADNVLNLRWRHKLILPTIASLPVVLVYYVQGGSTHVLMPDIFWKFFMAKSSTASAVDFGPLFYAFLSMLCVFGTNAINILAGINGLEVGQSIVLAAAMIINTLVQMIRHPDWGFEVVFSLYMLLPFLACSIALWLFNKYPSRVFVGDTYCYLAGTVLAVCAILGHSSKTHLLFMFPQVVNFVYSLPQLFRFIPCPRHRMPAYLPDVDMVDVSYTDWFIPSGTLAKAIVSIISTFNLAKIESKGTYIRLSNLTVINFVIWKIGKPVNEGKLAYVLLGWQIAWIIVAFLLRYKGAGLVYSVVD
jgi:UDP-N-acetylglucosamine--dolichyl-phosphate N-acetylglucosaminephosphotransferase